MGTKLSPWLEVELQTEAAENPAATHLNICATFSQMGRGLHSFTFLLNFSRV